MFVARRFPAPCAPPNADLRAFCESRTHESGETLIEILVAIVIMGLISSAAFFAISVGATSSKSHRDFVSADQLLRNAAEATKDAVRNDCTKTAPDDPDGTYSVPFSTLPATDGQTWHEYYEVDRDFVIPSDIANQPCPPATGASAVPVVPLSVELPSGRSRSLSIALRAP